MRRADSFEKTLMLGKIEGRKRRGRQRMGWVTSLTRWTWVWVNSRSWWWTGRPGVLWFMGLQRVRHDWVTELNWSSLPTPLPEETVFPLLCILVSPVEAQLTIGVRFISGLSILFCWSISLFFVSIPHFFDSYSFVVLSDVWKGYAFSLFFFLRIALSLLGLLWFHINCRTICLVLWKMSWVIW